MTNQYTFSTIEKTPDGSPDMFYTWKAPNSANKLLFMFQKRTSVMLIKSSFRTRTLCRNFDERVLYFDPILHNKGLGSLTWGIVNVPDYWRIESELKRAIRLDLSDPQLSDLI